MGNEFLTESAAAARALEAARREHARLKERADARLAAAKDRHAHDLEQAALVEAEGWAKLMEVTGMTVATAAVIGGTSEARASRWISRGRAAREQSCT
jgi:hypothetical protein